MSAVFAARSGAAVTLLEPNERLGKKLNITGKGRCNVTNDSSRDELIANVPRNGRFLYSVFSRWNGRDTMSFFESLGVPLKVERGKRVFPVSDRSFDISAALERELRRLNVRIVRERADCLEIENGCAAGARCNGRTYSADSVIIATGGLSYPATGSTGDGYRFAKQAGHTINEPRGSLVPLVCAGGDCAEMQGLSLKNILLTVKYNKKKTIFSEQGELLFTHFGVSGPLVLSASAHMRDFEKGSYSLSIDLKPALDEKKLDERLLRDLSERSNQSFSSVLGGLVPRSMIPVMVRRTEIPSDTRANSVTREQRRRLLLTLKSFDIDVEGTRGVEEAIITSGGVKVGEVDPGTMESKLVHGLYFAGEVLDVDAYTGGFNLQIAWATGKAAGEAAASKQRRTDMKKTHFAVAVDGPSGAGKSTLSKAVAKELGITYVDTGAIYRVIGLAAFRNDVDKNDADGIRALLPNIEIGMKYGDDGMQHMYLGNEDVSGDIRLPEISMYASAVSAYAFVRDYLLEMQRTLARKQSVIMDGRDIGTVVLPDAEVKIYLTANDEVRAKRRFNELEQRGTPKPYDEVLEELRQRDWNDTHREVAPLCRAEDAVLVDTSELDFEQSKYLILKTIREKLAQ